MPLSGSTPLTSIRGPNTCSVQFAYRTIPAPVALIAFVLRPTTLVVRDVTTHLRLNNAPPLTPSDHWTPNVGNSASSFCVRNVHCRFGRSITLTMNSRWVATPTNCSRWPRLFPMVSESLLHRSHNMVFTLRPSAHLGSLPTGHGLGTISDNSDIARFV